MSVNQLYPNERKSAFNSLGGASSETQRVSQIPYAAIETALRGMQFGFVQIIIQDGVVIQIDRTEKIRLRKTPS